MKKKPAPPTPPRARARATINRISTRPELPHGCSIPDCPSPRWAKGGRVGKDGEPELCPMHYHRELRDSPDAKVAGKIHGGGERKLVGFRPADEVREALEKWHGDELKQRAGEKLSQGNLCELALLEALQRRGYLSK